MALIQLFGEARRFSEYPLHIFSPPMQLVLTIIVPIAFAGFYPVEQILDGTTLSWFALLSVPVGAVCVAIGGAVFRLGLTQYQSTGS